MSIITLTTDFGTKDFSVAAVKGAIYHQNRNVTVVDISHEITPYHLYEAAYILNNACFTFPDNTVHIIGIDAERNATIDHLIVKIENQLFIGTDNGIFSLLAKEKEVSAIFKIEQFGAAYELFPTLNVFTSVASFLTKGVHWSKLGTAKPSFKSISALEPTVSESSNQITGKVIYIDHYGNVVTNITKEIFKRFEKERSYVIEARSVKIKEVFSSYSAAVEEELQKEVTSVGKKIAIFNSAGYLELAIYKSNPETTGAANTLFGLQYMDVVKVVFNSN